MPQHYKETPACVDPARRLLCHLALARSAASAKEPTPAADDRAPRTGTDGERTGDPTARIPAPPGGVILSPDAGKNGSLRGGFAKIDAKTPFTVLDKNADGKLSMNEFIDYRFEQYDECDANSDGVLSLQEVVDYVGK